MATKKCRKKNAVFMRLLAFRKRLTEIQEKRREQKEKNKVADELRTISDLNQYDAEIIGQIVEKVLVYDEGRIELVMKCQDAYEQVFREKADISA